MAEATSHLSWYPGHELVIGDIVRADNCHLYDARGKRYVDLESGVWCTSIGHANPRVRDAIAEQSARIAHTGYNYSCAIVEEAAREILGLLGFDGGRCVFLCSGSEAIEYGVRVAQSIIGRPLLMTMTDSYCGAYGSAARKDDTEWWCFDWTACARCPETVACDERCEHWAAIPFGEIGGFLLEPGSSSGLVRFPPQKLVRSIVDVIGSNRGVALVNEVTTGTGRTGEWFGYQHYWITPGIVALGKGIGNGYPVSVAAFAPGVVARLGDDSIPYAQSHQNDPLGAAVVLAVVREIRERGLIENSREAAGQLVTGLQRIRSQTGGIRAIRGRGLMMAVELEDDAETSRTIRVHTELIRRGFLVARRPGTSVLRIDPPLTIEHQDIEDFVAALEDVLAGGAT
jgi:acetylornithine aminotransferase